MPEEKSRESAEELRLPDRIRFDYVKSNFFRVVHADGVVGGITPTLQIHMDVWSERQPIPKRVVHAVKEDGTLGEELKEEREVRDAVVREVEVGVVLNVNLARNVVTWLQEKIEQAERIMQTRDKREEV